MAFCGYCGSNVPDGMKFCTNCGKPLRAPINQNTNNAQGVPGAQNPGQTSPNMNYSPRNMTGSQGMNGGYDPNMDPRFNSNAQNYYNQAYTAPEKLGLWDRIKSFFGTMHKAAKVVAGVIALVFFISLISMIVTIAKGEKSNSVSNSGRQNITASSSSGSSTSSTTGKVDPDLKEFLDSYEDFMDGYVDFMKRYTNNPANAMSMMGEYFEMLQKYEDFAEKADKYDSNSMSSADAAYYLEVMTRIEKKMLDIY